MKSSNAGLWDFGPVRELIRDCAFVAGLVVVSAAIFHRPGYLRSEHAAQFAMWAILVSALVYGAFAGMDFWRSFIGPRLPGGLWGYVAFFVGTVVLTFLFQLLVFMAADFGDNTARLQ